MDGQQGVLHRILGLRRIADAAAGNAAQQRQGGAEQGVIGPGVAGLRRDHPGLPFTLPRHARCYATSAGRLARQFVAIS